MKYKIIYRNNKLYGGNIYDNEEYCNTGYEKIDREDIKKYDFFKIDKDGNIIKKLDNYNEIKNQYVKKCNNKIRKQLNNKDKNTILINEINKKINKMDKDKENIEEINKKINNLLKINKKITETDIFNKTMIIPNKKLQDFLDWLEETVDDKRQEELNKSERTCYEKELYDILIDNTRINPKLLFENVKDYLNDKINYEKIKNNINVLHELMVKIKNKDQCKNICKKKIEDIIKKYKDLTNENYKDAKNEIYKLIPKNSWATKTECSRELKLKEEYILKLNNLKKNRDIKKIVKFLKEKVFKDKSKKKDGYIVLDENLTSGEIYNNFYNVLGAIRSNSGPIGRTIGTGYWINEEKGNEYEITKLLSDISKHDSENGSIHIFNMINYIENNY
jgi:hypothetical protein